MKRLVILILFLPIITMAQNDNGFVAKGLLSAKGTLAVGFPTAYKGTNMYISCNAEYYLEDNISFRGGLYIFLGTSGAEAVLKQNSTLFTGFYYHIKTKNHIDPYLGLEPGISWTQLKHPDNITDEFDVRAMSAYKSSASPVASIATGINFYATKWVHIFIEGKYQYGVHVSDLPAVSLSEFKLAFGFGFNLWAMKKKKSI